MADQNRDAGRGKLVGGEGRSITRKNGAQGVSENGGMGVSEKGGRRKMSRGRAAGAHPPPHELAAAFLGENYQHGKLARQAGKTALQKWAREGTQVGESPARGGATPWRWALPHTPWLGWKGLSGGPLPS